MDEFNSETRSNNEGSIPNQQNYGRDTLSEEIASLSNPRNVHRRAGIDVIPLLQRLNPRDAFRRLAELTASALRRERATERLRRRSRPRRLVQMSTVSITQSDVDNQLECSVCLEPYHVNEPAKQLGCDHKFHRKCIKRWLKNHETCPFCRHIVVRL